MSDQVQGRGGFGSQGLMSPDRAKKFYRMALAMADEMSKDRKKKVGAIAIGPDGEIRSTGYNGFPRGVDEQPDGRHLKPVKLQYTCHAEENVVAQAARVGVSLKGCSLVVTTLFPCTTCARLIIQAGIVEVFAPTPSAINCNPHWIAEAQVSQQMFDEAKIRVHHLGVEK